MDMDGWEDEWTWMDGWVSGWTWMDVHMPCDREAGDVDRTIYS